MIMPIIVNQGGLQDGVSKLQSLRSGSMMGKSASDMFTLSVSETSDAALELYEKLQQTEELFLLLVEKTIQAMEAAGVSFQEADQTAANHFTIL